jgi:hypothetical protein
MLTNLMVLGEMPGKKDAMNSEAEASFAVSDSVDNLARILTDRPMHVVLGTDQEDAAVLMSLGADAEELLTRIAVALERIADARPQ